jgi:hypothetical protein
MSDERNKSLGDLPESIRYRKLLEGESLTNVRVTQGLSTAAEFAGSTMGKIRQSRREAKQRKRVQQDIESGRIQDLQ